MDRRTNKQTYRQRDRQTYKRKNKSVCLFVRTYVRLFFGLPHGSIYVQMSANIYMWTGVTTKCFFVEAILVLCKYRFENRFYKYPLPYIYLLNSCYAEDDIIVVVTSVPYINNQCFNYSQMELWYRQTNSRTYVRTNKQTDVFFRPYVCLSVRLSVRPHHSSIYE